MEKLLKATKKLIEFIEENHITDEAADDGDGHTDEWRSDEFQQLINNVKDEGYLFEILNNVP